MVGQNSKMGSKRCELKKYTAYLEQLQNINWPERNESDLSISDVKFAGDKEIFRNLKLIVDDIVASTLVE